MTPTARAMATLGWVGVMWLYGLGYSFARADDPKSAPAKPGPPRVILLDPLAIEAGGERPVELRVRGVDLTNVTRIVWRSRGKEGSLEPITRGTVPIPDGLTAARAGDQQLTLRIPEAVFGGKGEDGAVALRFVTPLGTNDSARLRVVPRHQLIGEHEPNNGFQQAQEVRSGQFILGRIDSLVDVDVFLVHLEAGETLEAEVEAGRLGSLLDPSLTLHAAGGQILRVQDDGPGVELGRDARLVWTTPRSGRFYLSLSGVTEHGGSLHPYLLHIQVTPGRPSALPPADSTPGSRPAKLRP